MTINPTQLGRLEKVDLRTIFASEAGDFTPWLAKEENLLLLGQTIGFELVLEAQEKSVGPFRADVLCKDTATEHWVLIENQLERTDHTHLGQLITYAAGLKTVTIVWIASPFTEEHRAALDWLNEITDNRFNFFGLGIELWRIGNSPVAPKFNIVCKPNDWAKTVTAKTSQLESTSLSENKQLQVNYWTAFRDFVASKESQIRPTKPMPQNWMNISIGRAGFNLAAIASLYDTEAGSWDSNELRVELVIDSLDSKAYFEQILQQKAEIESELGFPLTWYNKSDVRTCRIYVRKSTNLRDEANWQIQHQWLYENLESFYKIFRTRVLRLELA